MKKHLWRTIVVNAHDGKAIEPSCVYLSNVKGTFRWCLELPERPRMRTYEKQLGFKVVANRYTVSRNEVTY